MRGIGVERAQLEETICRKTAHQRGKECRLEFFFCCCPCCFYMFLLAITIFNGRKRERNQKSAGAVVH